MGNIPGRQCDQQQRFCCASFWFVVLFLMGNLLAAGQTNLPSASKGDEAQGVSFYLSILNQQGQAVQDLAAKDFEVFEDKVPQTISSLEFQKEAPISLGILIDISRSMGGGTTIALNWVKSLAQKMKSPDEFFVNAFSDESQEMTDFISPEDYLDEPLNSLNVGGQARTGLAIDLALIKLRDARNPKRGLLVISPGRDIAGRATLEHIARTRYPIYALGLRGIEGLTGTIDRLKALNVRGSALNVYAEQSGGQAFFASSPSDGEQWLEKFYAGFKNQYRLEYRSTNSRMDGKLRQISVKVQNPAFEVHWLKKYQAPYRKPRSTKALSPKEPSL